jgi:ureidoglycolate hydrolase
MKTIIVETLSVEAFQSFGVFANMLSPSSERLGSPPIEFFRDMLVQSLGTSTISSFSNCRIAPRPQIIDCSEYHDRTSEMLMPLDGDTLMHFAPASLPGNGFPHDSVRVFLVPKGTMVVIKPGTWHHAPFCTGSLPVNILVALPERTYVNDCHSVSLEDPQKIAIQTAAANR